MTVCVNAGIILGSLSDATVASEIAPIEPVLPIELTILSLRVMSEAFLECLAPTIDACIGELGFDAGKGELGFGTGNGALGFDPWDDDLDFLYVL